MLNINQKVDLLWKKKGEFPFWKVFVLEAVEYDYDKYYFIGGSPKNEGHGDLSHLLLHRFCGPTARQSDSFISDDSLWTLYTLNIFNCFLYFSDALANKDGSGDKKEKKKDKKEPFYIKYNEEINFDLYFKETRAATTLSKATLDKYSKTSTTLPEDLHYETEKLFRLFTRSKMMVSFACQSITYDLNST